MALHFFSILDPKVSFSEAESVAAPEKETSKSLIDLASFDELEAYVNNQIDYKEVGVTSHTLESTF